MYDFTIRRREMIAELNRRTANKNAAHRARLAWEEGTPMRRRLALTIRELERERREALAMARIPRAGLDDMHTA